MNIVNSDIKESDIKEAKNLNIEFIRVIFNQLKSLERDFLIEDLDQ